MGSGKRASMREGPLAALFRKTETEGLEPPVAAAPEPPAPKPEAAPDTPRIPTPQERLRHAFSSDLPENIMAPPAAAPPPAAPAAYYPPSPEAIGSPQLRVVGVGGAGVNAVNRMIEAEVAGVEFIAVNTDAQSLQQSDANHTLQIGGDLTNGLGSGSDPERGRNAAMEDYDRIKAQLKGSDMVFITAGEGGGTGTGGAPVVARIARELGALTVGIVSKPFGFEGSRRAQAAEQGIQALADEVDTLIVVPNNRLLSVLDKQTSMVEAFRVADDVLRQGVQGISDLITLPGLINLDFADVRTIMSEAGSALLGIGMGHGEKRAIDAAAQAVSSPLLETTLEGAKSILLSITGGSRPLAVGGQRGGPGRRGGRAPRREHHLRRDGRREARGAGLGDRRGDGLRRQARAARRRAQARPARADGRAARQPHGPAAARHAHRRRRARVHAEVLSAGRCAASSPRAIP